MKMENLRELKFRDILYEVESGRLVQVMTPPRKYETDDAKISVLCACLTSKVPDEVGKDFNVTLDNMVEWDNIALARERITDPHLWATLQHLGIVIDSVSQFINNGVMNAQAQAAKSGIQL